MQTVRLGRTNVDVSVAGLGSGGASRLGMARGATSQEASRIVSAAIDLGITFIDTAPTYGTEEAVGIGVNGRRDEMFISTKSLALTGPDGQLLTPAAMAQGVERSLRLLRTDRIDLFLLHGLQSGQYGRAVETLLPEMQRLRDAGKLRFLGISEMFLRDPSHACLIQAAAEDHFDVVMVGFSLLNPSARRSVLPLTRAHDVGTLIMFAVRRALSDPETLKAVVAGLIDSGQLAPDAVNRGDPLDFLRNHPEVRSLVEAGYRFCRHEPGADVVLTGTGSVEHLKENVASILGRPLPPAVSARLQTLFGDLDTVTGN